MRTNFGVEVHRTSQPGQQKYRECEDHDRARNAERAAAQWENELREGIVDCRKVTWAQFRERYENEVLAELGRWTPTKKCKACSMPSKSIVGPNRLRDLTAERISLLQFKLRDSGAGRVARSRATWPLAGGIAVGR